ncbi:MAG: lytic transglycosylase domain-containing protein [Candidatus Kerfeldbacteria bacterium]|nr:lytic transglycosylase domain-containing protein [Candidatus Kerfeldbacteria bacterium]
MRRYLFTLIIIGAGLFVVAPSVVSAQGLPETERCCVKGPGECYSHTNPETAQCEAFGYVMQSQPCDQISTCRQRPTATVRCCVCPPHEGIEGQCFVVKPDEPQGCAATVCNASGEVCTEIDQCIQWRGETQTTPEDNPRRLVSFIPQVSIPFSSIFNEGRTVVITGATLGEYIIALYVFLVSVAGILSTVFVMYGGFRYIISFGNQSQIQSAKETISSALIGLLIAVASYTILLTINPNLVKFDGIKIERQFPIREFEIKETPEKTSSGFAVTANTSTFDNCLTAEAANIGIDRDWLKALMLVESSGNPKAKSSVGACGLIQLMPSTAAKYSGGITCEQLLNPATNINIAAQLYRDLLNGTCPKSATYKSGKKASCFPEQTQCKNGDHKYANAAYNGGVGANCSSVTCPGQTWWECVENPGYAETRNYVGKVQAAYEKIIQSKNNPGQFPDYVWQDATTPTCAVLRTMTF